MSVQLKAASQAEIVNLLREFANQLDRGIVVVIDMDQSMMQERGSDPEWLMTLRWKWPPDNGEASQ